MDATAVDFFRNRLAAAGLAHHHAVASQWARNASPAEFGRLSADSLKAIAPDLAAAEQWKILDAAAQFTRKPVSVLVLACESASRQLVAGVAEYLRMRMPGEKVEVDHGAQGSLAASLRLAGKCHTLLCILDADFYADERALAVLTSAVLAKAEVRGVRIPAGGDEAAAFKRFVRHVRLQPSDCLHELLGAPLVSRLELADTHSFSASEVHGALVALADSYPAATAVDDRGTVLLLPALFEDVGFERAFPVQPPFARPPRVAVAAVAAARSTDLKAGRLTFVPMEELKALAGTRRVGTVGVQLTDIAERDNLGSIFCYTLPAVSRVFKAWGFIPKGASEYTPVKKKRQNGVSSGIVFGRIRFRFEDAPPEGDDGNQSRVTKRAKVASGSASSSSASLASSASSSSESED